MSARSGSADLRKHDLLSRLCRPADPCAAPPPPLPSPGVCAVLVLLACMGCGWAWVTARRAGQAAATQVAQAAEQVEDLREQLQALELYRVSLELDAGRWMRAEGSGAGGSGGVGANGTATAGASPWQCHGGSGAGAGSNRSLPWCGPPSAGAAGGMGQVHGQHPLLQPGGPLSHALQSELGGHGKGSGSGASGTGKAAGAGGGAGHEGAGATQHAASQSLGIGDPPDPWQYVAHASAIYATFLNEWMKQQLAEVS